MGIKGEDYPNIPNFVIFYSYSLVIASTAWGTYETVTVLVPTDLSYRDFIAVYVQSIAGSVVTSMLIIDLMRSIKMLSNAIEDWLIEKRKKRDAYWRAYEAELREKERLREEKERLREEKRREQAMQLRNEGREYERIVAAHQARGEDPPPPPWDSNEN